MCTYHHVTEMICSHAQAQSFIFRSFLLYTLLCSKCQLFLNTKNWRLRRYLNDSEMCYRIKNIAWLILYIKKLPKCVDVQYSYCNSRQLNEMCSILPQEILDNVTHLPILPYSEALKILTRGVRGINFFLMTIMNSRHPILMLGPTWRL